MSASSKDNEGVPCELKYNPPPIVYDVTEILFKVQGIREPIKGIDFVNDFFVLRNRLTDLEKSFRLFLIISAPILGILLTFTFRR